MFCVLALTMAASAQSDDESVYVGFKAGISLPNLVGGGDQEITRDYKSRLAPNFGMVVEFQRSPRLSIQTGVDYAPQGGKRDGIQPITQPLPGLPSPPAGSYWYGDFKNTAKLDYIEAPLLFKYTTRPGAKVRPYVNAGPYVGVLVRARTVTKGSSTIYVNRTGQPLLLPPGNQPLPAISWDADTDVTDSLNRFNIGVTGGGGVKMMHKNNYFFIDARAAYGLRTLQKNTLTDGKSRTGNLVISVGYAFKVK